MKFPPLPRGWILDVLAWSEISLCSLANSYVIVMPMTTGVGKTANRSGTRLEVSLPYRPVSPAPRGGWSAGWRSGCLKDSGYWRTTGWNGWPKQGPPPEHPLSSATQNQRPVRCKLLVQSGRLLKGGCEQRLHLRLRRCPSAHFWAFWMHFVSAFWRYCTLHWICTLFPYPIANFLFDRFLRKVLL